MTPERVKDPAGAVRATMAVVTATMAGEHGRAEELAAELTATQSRFTLLVLAEYLNQALNELASQAGADSNELWRRYCLRTEQAIQQVHGPDDGGPAPRS
ncbi:MAG: hypothetical protein R2761_18790 [Acidimicrobiales bacterium]